MGDSPSESAGPLAAGKRILRTVFDLAQTRVELFVIELKEERIRVVDALLLLAIGTVCASMTLVLLTFIVVLIFWEHRLLALVLLTLSYGALATGAFCILRKRLAEWNSFSATLNELKKDRACLDKPN